MAGIARFMDKSGATKRFFKRTGRKMRKVPRNGKAPIAKFQNRKLAMIPWPDLKQHTMSQQTITASTTVTITYLNLVDQGVGEAQRVGNDITMRSILLRALINSSGSPGTSHPSFFRFIIIYAPARIGLPSALSVLNSAQVESPRNLQTAKDYVFLYDKIHSINSLQPTKTFMVSLKGKWPVRYNLAVPIDQDDIDYGSLFIMTLANNTSANNSLFFIPRIRYTDS